MKKIKLGEAVLIMKAGEIFRPDEGDDVELLECGEFDIKNGRGHHETVIVDQKWMKQEGEIIRAEPEVLTVGEIVTRFKSNHVSKIHNFDFTTFFIDIAYQADKNGQIKEWKRLKPLIDYVRTIFVAGNVFKYHQSADMVEFVKNLTPPWEPEK